MNPLEYQSILEATFAERFRERFYSTIELEKGVFTDGWLPPNIGLTRTLLGRTQVEEKACCDVASVDGWCLILMARRGASRLAAFDRNDFTHLIQKVKSSLSIEFDYFPLTRSDNWSRVAKDSGFNGFDVVVNSGLLYHVLGPLNVLAATRSLLRTGGILILETVFDASSDGYTMRFNSCGCDSKDDPTFFWSISPKMLEYMIRMLRLVPIDMCFFGNRMAIACRATDDIVAPLGDEWLPRTYQARDVLDLVDWTILGHKSFVQYQLPSHRSSGSNGIDVHSTFKSEEPLYSSQNSLRIALEDII